MPNITGTPSVTGITSTGATVTWTTDVASDSQVEYGTTSGYGSTSALNPAGVTSHSVTLTGLTAGTTYHYRVRSADAVASSDPLTTPGIVARWRAADLTGLSGNDPVGVWASTVGGLVATQPLASQRPIYVVGAQGGRAGLQFDGVSDHLNAGDVLGFTGAFTAQFVLKFTDANQYSMIATKSNGLTAADSAYECRRDAATDHLQLSAGVGGALQGASTADTTLGAYHVYTLVADPAGSAQWYLDGVASGSPTAFSPAGALATVAADFLIGGRRSNGALQPYAAPMVLLELNLYSGALDDATRHARELFLGSYYGLTVA
jgi:hypothetical protein